jgi:hypothetical protein
MKKIICGSILTLVLWNCKNTENNKEPLPVNKSNETVVSKPQTNTKETVKPASDTLIVTQTALILHQASTTEIQKWKNENPESFGESVSDNLTYLDEAQTAAKKQHIAIVQTDANFISFVNQQGTGKVWTRGVQFEGWGAIAYKENGSPAAIEITNSAAEINKYFK